MNFMYSFFFAGGIAALIYSKFGRRVGYGNSKNIFTILAVTFVIAFIFFYTLATYILHLH